MLQFIQNIREQRNNHGDAQVVCNANQNVNE